METHFLDANIPMYAGGRGGEFKEPCVRLLVAVADGRLDGRTDAEVLQEILHRFLAIGRREEGFMIFDDFARVLDGRTLGVEPADARLARELAARHPGVPARDLLHVAVCIRAGIRRIASFDTHFDRFREIERVDPRRLAASFP